MTQTPNYSATPAERFLETVADSSERDVTLASYVAGGWTPILGIIGESGRVTFHRPLPRGR